MAIAFDQVVFRDLSAAHAAAVDVQVINGTGLNGQMLGVHGTRTSKPSPRRRQPWLRRTPR
jgi:hypothetical protein